jgi:hypothetical protein
MNRMRTMPVSWPRDEIATKIVGAINLLCFWPFATGNDPKFKTMQMNWMAAIIRVVYHDVNDRLVLLQASSSDVVHDENEIGLNG